MDLETLKIDLKGLKEGANHLTFDLDDTYFKAIDAPEVSQGRVHVSLDVVRTGNDFFTLDFHETGMVLVPCDICLELMEQPIETTQRLEVRLGTENSEEDDLVTVAEDEGILDVAWYLYEFIALAIPIKHVHAPGKKAVAPTLAVCPNCGAYYVYHTVCPTCGYYRGKVAVVKETAE